MREFNLGWIGAGGMGSSMCIRLLDAGCSFNLPQELKYGLVYWHEKYLNVEILYQKKT
jgi:hypothetical protein